MARKTKETSSSRSGSDTAQTEEPHRLSLSGIAQRLAQPVPADSVAIFRSGYGLLMAWSMVHFVFAGRAERLLYGTIVKFRYPGFEWVPVLSKTGTLVICWILLIAALSIGLGIRYRLASGVFAAGYGYLMLYDVANYNNHDYLVVMLGAILALIPHSSVATITRSSSPRTVPTWALWLLCFHIALPYFFGGIAKLGSDWIIRHQPMTLWFQKGGVEGLERAVANPERWGTLLSLGGVVFDLAIVPLLLWKPTRALACTAAIGFHLTNSQLFDIGPFPWLMIVATTLFLSPAWPQTLRLTRRSKKGRPASSPSPVPKWALALLAGWLIFQCALPFRHLLYPGEVNWNEKGFRFAWRMKLRDKAATTTFQVAEGAGSWKRIDALEAALTKRQLRMMEHKPEMVRQFAEFLRGKLDPNGNRKLKIRVDQKVSLNGRRPQNLINPAVDLLSLDPGVSSSAWLLPLQTDRD